MSLTQHAITIRPICFSGKTLRRLPDDLQDAIIKAGKEAGVYGRELESSQDAETLVSMESEGKLKTHLFTEREKLLQLSEPIKEAYAEEIGSGEILARINSIK